ncbi:dihydroneopterin aldolase [Sphingomonas vulcanisoli]|uniref:Dihydroneopterin aldolase n=2 Tax=Sphingomonas vulcanisoli TaxID=1658060 RepID=A0ABX0TRD5_9SPHN|nr:dihydroneopterin aldolase [Sphingomonas vulcanisoli]
MMPASLAEPLSPPRDSIALVHADDLLRLEVDDIAIDLLTGIYSEETHLPQPLRISIAADLNAPPHFTLGTPLSQSKNYLDLRDAVLKALPRDRHFTLIEAIADHIADTLFLGDSRVRRVEVKIVKLAISEGGEAIGMTLVRHRR